MYKAMLWTPSCKRNFELSSCGKSLLCYDTHLVLPNTGQKTYWTINECFKDLDGGHLVRHLENHNFLIVKLWQASGCYVLRMFARVTNENIKILPVGRKERRLDMLNKMTCIASVMYQKGMSFFLWARKATRRMRELIALKLVCQVDWLGGRWWTPSTACVLLWMSPSG